MLIAALGVVAALAFVLGLGALCLWALKRWGKMSLTSRTRVAVEVVQRVPLGPKTGLAVIRVGEKVMAVSVGEGGIRTLFELDEVDRQRVIASSQIPMPMESSSEASASFAKFLPSAFGKTLQHTMESTAEPGPVAAPPLVSAVAVFSPTEPCEIPSFLTSPPVTQRGQPLSYGPPVPRPSLAAERDFRAMLGGAMSGATRLAVFAGAMILASAVVMPLRAQAAPPTSPPTSPPTNPPATSSVPPSVAIPVAASAVTPAVAADAPQPLPLPAFPAGAGAQQTARQTAAPGAPVAPVAPQFSLPSSVRTATAGTTAPVKPRSGNGASVTPGGAAARRQMSQMQIDSTLAAAKSPRAGAAQPAPVGADEAIMRMMPQMDVQLGDAKDGGLRLNGTVGIVVMMGLLTLLPTLLLMMTGFTRILIVLHFLKQAMGTQSAPPAQLLAAMALLLTGFVMAPTLSEVNSKAITPWLDGKITQVEMMKTGVAPMREFMLKQTRESDLKTFVDMSRLPRPNTAEDVPLHVLMSAFVASELRTAFQIGFAIYLPFIIIDAVVASVLMSMGMFMLPPAMISLPFKLLLFVLVDGWTLTISSLVQSFK
ncbi:MAG: flagellar type III secretion system pore protein FliP [Gemmatimonadaceae bacterium]|nr:flagellar type III secretion system pore protein FliP [Gemmatimonadaceae bacterium]